MKNLQILLTPKRGSFHIGDDLKGLERAKEYIHSDTLFSGLIQSFVRLYGKSFVDELFENGFNKGNPPFIVSSGFLTNERLVSFLPKPKIPISILEEKIPENHRERAERVLKKYKELKFLPASQIKSLLMALSKEVMEINTLEDAITKANEYSGLYRTVVRPSASIDRISSQSELFFRGETFLKESVKISIFCKYDDAIVNEVKEAFKCLGDFGIGGERTYGLGQFTANFFELSQTDFIFSGVNVDNTPNNFAYLLSLYYPNSDELSKIKDNSFYALIERKGWFDSPYTHTQLKRKSVMMFEEGSVVSLPNIKGSLVDVSPEYWINSNIPEEHKHKIFRNGLAFSIPFNLRLGG